MELVTAVLVTRGDVDLAPILDSLPPTWPVVVWDNSGRVVALPRSPAGVRNGAGSVLEPVPDLSVCGRYVAIERHLPLGSLVYVQDDDVIVSDPQEIVDAYLALGDEQALFANMPWEFRHDGYTDSCLVGFGAAFHRDLPGRLFQRFLEGQDVVSPDERSEFFNRTCDVVFTTLAPRRVLLNVPRTDREFASDPGRMWKQPGHVEERTRMLELARQVRDA